MLTAGLGAVRHKEKVSAPCSKERVGEITWGYGDRYLRYLRYLDLYWFSQISSQLRVPYLRVTVPVH